MHIKSIQTVSVARHGKDASNVVNDVVTIESPLEIQIQQKGYNRDIAKPITITMRTPGNDEDLAIGFLFTEGIISKISDIEHIRTIDENRILICLSENIGIKDMNMERNFYTTSSCGVCGKASIDAIKTIPRIQSSYIDTRIDKSTLFRVPEHLRGLQSNFDQTGGIHASAVLDIVHDQWIMKEDVGRHNALDKLIGHLLRHDSLHTSPYLVVFSGRASFELIQKSYMAGLQLIASIGAPSSLAVSLAEEQNITLVGFLKNVSFNIYSHSYRVV